MHNKILIFLLLILITKVNAQGYREIYYPGVQDVEVLELDFWIEDGGKISEVMRVPEKSTFDNPELVNKLIAMLEKDPMGNYTGEKIKAQFTIKLINPKYKNRKLTAEECEKLDFLKDGKFVYLDPAYADFVVERSGQNQVEKSGKKIIKGEIEWLSNCEYNIFNPESENKSNFKKTDIVHVEIIGLLNNYTVVYKSVLNGETYTGLMRKL